jgi:hypothetical protein
MATTLLQDPEVQDRVVEAAGTVDRRSREASPAIYDQDR